MYTIYTYPCRPVLNVDSDPKDVMIRNLQNEIKTLRHRLDNKNNLDK